MTDSLTLSLCQSSNTILASVFCVIIISWEPAAVAKDDAVSHIGSQKLFTFAHTVSSYIKNETGRRKDGAALHIFYPIFFSSLPLMQFGRRLLLDICCVFWALCIHLSIEQVFFHRELKSWHFLRCCLVCQSRTNWKGRWHKKWFDRPCVLYLPGPFKFAVTKHRKLQELAKK